MDDEIQITVAGFQFVARLEIHQAPKTCEAVRAMLPLETNLIHARWSGEACWIPLGELSLHLTAENATSYPAVGELLLYPGGISETEVLVPYGPTAFASRAGQLAGNHFATIHDGGSQLAELGRLVLWHGAQVLSVRDR